MAHVKLSARAKCIIVAGETLAGPRWQSALARASGVSQSYLAMIASGDRPVTDDVDRKVAPALAREADRLRVVALKLDDIALRILRSLESDR
jgi:transcriptional regulator with XRE-family HTH domain